ncbi:MAG TPA: hypothetical protein VFE61_26795 [Candidatus Sulfotelmatobacter sp.]|jgi:hypothetical protein|nr:hypothetical protein [Candidatus Sulfotelmatobacter sp.]
MLNLKVKVQTVLGLFLILAGTIASAQIEYYGDIVDLNAPAHPVLATVHASADRRRLEIKTEDDDSLVQRLPRAKVGNIGND